MGNQFGTNQTIFSFVELKTYISNFHALTICHGVQFFETCNLINSIKKGLINQLYKWQSI